VRHGAGWLKQKQTAPGIIQYDSSSNRVASDRQKITFVVIAAKREFESVFASGRPVAGARTATRLGQNGLDVVSEAPFEWLVRVRHRHFCAGRLPSPFDFDSRNTVRDRKNNSGVNPKNIGIAHR
jgi:hypothetical protein